MARLGSGAATGDGDTKLPAGGTPGRREGPRDGAADAA